MDQRYLITRQICTKILINKSIEEHDRIQLHKQVVQCPLLIRLILDNIEETLAHDQPQIAHIKNIEIALLILLNTSTPFEHYAETLVALLETIDKISTNHKQLHLTCATLQSSTLAQTRAVLAVILLLERSEQFKASWVDLLIIELRAKINNIGDNQLAFIAHDWLWAAKQISWKNASNSTVTLFDQVTQLIEKKHYAVPKVLRDASSEEFKVSVVHIQNAIEELCNAPHDQWLCPNIDTSFFFAAPSTFIQCIPAKDLFEPHLPTATAIPDNSSKQKLLEVTKTTANSKYIELSHLFSSTYRLVLNNQLDRQRLCTFLAVIAEQLEYSSQLEFFNSMLALCCEYRTRELSYGNAVDSIQSIDLPINSSTAFALTSWTLIMYCQRLHKNAQLSDVLEIIAQLYEFDSAGVAHNSPVLDWSNASIIDLVLVSLLRNTAMTAQFEALVDRGKIWMNKFKAMKPILKVSLLKFLFQSIVHGVTTRVTLHRWFFEFQRQLLRAFTKDDSAALSKTVVSAIAALLGDVTSMTDGVLSPVSYNDGKLDLLLKFLLIYDDTCQQKESEQTPVAMLLESMLKDTNALLINHGLNLLSLLMFKNFISIHKIKLDSANIVFHALESSPEALLECLMRRLPHEPKTVVIAYEKAIGRAARTEKLKTFDLLKTTNEKVKRALSDTTLNISILASLNENINAFSFNVVETFRTSPNELKRALSNIQNTDDNMSSIINLMDHLINTVRKVHLTRDESTIDISRKDLARLVSSLVAWKQAKWQELQVSLLPLPEELSNHVLQALHTNTTPPQSTSYVLPLQAVAVSSLFQSSLDWQDSNSLDKISFYGNQAIPCPPPSWTPWLTAPSLPTKNIKPLTTLRLEGLIKSYLDFVTGLPNLDLLTRFFVVSVLGSKDRLFTQALIDTAVNIESWLLDHVIVEECQVVFSRLTRSTSARKDDFYLPFHNLVQLLLKWPRSLWHNIFDSTFNRSITTDQSCLGLLHLLEFIEEQKTDLSECTSLCGRLQYCLSRPSINTQNSWNQLWSALFKRVWKMDYSVLDPSTVEFGLIEWLDWELIAFTDPTLHLSQVSMTDLEAYHKRMIDTLTSRPVQHRRNKLSVDMESALKHTLLTLLKHNVNSYNQHQYMEYPKFVTALFDKLCQIINNPNNTTVNHYLVTVWLFQQFQQIEALVPIISFIDKVLPHILLVPFMETEDELKAWADAWSKLYKRVRLNDVFARVLIISTARGWCLRHSLLGASKSDKAKQTHLEEMLSTVISPMNESVKSAIISQLTKDFSVLRDSKRSSAIDKSFKYFENKCAEIEFNDEMAIDQTTINEIKNPFESISRSPMQKSRSLAQSSVDLPIAPSSPDGHLQNNTNAMARLNRSLDLIAGSRNPVRLETRPSSLSAVSPKTPALPPQEHLQVALPREDDSLANSQMDIELSLPKELSDVQLDMSENDLFEDMALIDSPKNKSNKAVKSPKTPTKKSPASKKATSKAKANSNRKTSAEEEKQPENKDIESKESSASDEEAEIELKKNTKSKASPKNKTTKKDVEVNDSAKKKTSTKSPVQKINKPSNAKSPKSGSNTKSKKSPASKKKSSKKEESEESDKEEKKEIDAEKSEKSESESSKKSDSEKSHKDSDKREESSKSQSSKSKKSARSREEKSEASSKSESEARPKNKRRMKSKPSSDSDSDSEEKSASSKSSAKSSSSKSSSKSAKSSSSSSSKSSQSTSSSASEKSESKSSRKSKDESDDEKSEKSKSASVSEDKVPAKKKKNPPKNKPQRPNGRTTVKKSPTKPAPSTSASPQHEAPSPAPKEGPASGKKLTEAEKKEAKRIAMRIKRAKERLRKEAKAQKRKTDTKLKQSTDKSGEEKDEAKTKTSIKDKKKTTKDTAKTTDKDSASDSEKKTNKSPEKKTPTKESESNHKQPVLKEKSPAVKTSEDKKKQTKTPEPSVDKINDTRQNINLPLSPVKSPTVPSRTLSSQSQTKLSLDLPLSQDTIDLTVSTDVNGSIDGDCVVLSSQGPIDDDFQPSGSHLKRKRSDTQTMKSNKRAKATSSHTNTTQELSD